jgi:hypothetical protein
MSGRDATTIELVELSGSTPPSDEVAAVLESELRRVRSSRLDIVRNWEVRRRGVQRALHDGAQQQLLALRLALMGQLPNDELELRIVEISADIGRLAIGLPTRAMNIDNIVDGLRQIAEQSGLEVRLDAPEQLPLSVVVAEAIAFTASEALANSLRHAPGASCAMSLRAHGRMVEFEISDNGRGGAHIAGGHGLEGLASRAEELGGSLVVRSDHRGTTLKLSLSDAAEWSPSRDPTPSVMPTWDATSRDALRQLTGDDQLELWFAVGDQTLRDEHGLQPGGDADSDRLVRLLYQGELVAVLAASAGPALAAVCQHPSAQLAAGRSRAEAARQLLEFGEERDRAARRAAAFEASLARRLTTRPLQHLTAASTEVAAGRREHASELVLRATDTLRDIIRVLGSSVATMSEDVAGADPYLFCLVADRAEVGLDVAVRDVPADPARTAIARIGEELICDAMRGELVRIRVASTNRSVTVAVTLQRLPSPTALAFVEDMALLLHGSVHCSPIGSMVRVRIDIPC